jgi:hypothetical protein
VKPLQLIMLAPESWRPIEPSAGRSSNRTSERELEQIPARIRLGDAVIAVRLWDYSPFGFSLLLPQTAQADGLRIGTSASVELEMGDQQAAFGCRVENVGQFKGQIRLGLSRTDLEAGAADSRAGLSVGDALILWGETRNPLLYGEWCALRLESVRPGMRMVFTSSDPTLLTFVGQEMVVELGVPTSGDAAFRGRVVGLSRLPGERVTLTLDPVRISSRLASELGELLAMESGASPSELKALGFPVTFLRDRLLFRHAEGDEDLARVAELRKLSSREPSLDGGADARRHPLPLRPGPEMRLLCAFHEETLVAALLLGFPKAGKTCLGYPAGESDRRPAMEVLDIATHPDYRRGDLWLSLVERTSRIFLLSGRASLKRVCGDRLLPLYRKMGFAETVRDGGGEGPSRLLVLDRSTVLHGRGIGTPAWATLYGDLIEDFLDKGLLELPAWQALRLRVLLTCKRWFQSRAAARAERMFQSCIKK